MKKLLSSEDLKKNYKKIWNKIKPLSESIEAVTDWSILDSSNIDEDHYRLTNLKMQYIRALIFAESEKYISEKKPTKEGYVIDYDAVEYCYQKIIINNYKKNNQIVRADILIKEEAHDWAYLGIHPKINEIAKKSYQLGNTEIMRQFVILTRDKDLDFNAPAVQFIKKNSIIVIFIVLIIIIYLIK